MTAPVYKKITVVGTSRDSIEGAVQNAVATAGKSIRHLSWFEVNEVRGHIAEGKVNSYQVEVAIGFDLEKEVDNAHLPPAL